MEHQEIQEEMAWTVSLALMVFQASKVSPGIEVNLEFLDSLVFQVKTESQEIGDLMEDQVSKGLKEMMEHQELMDNRVSLDSLVLQVIEVNRGTLGVMEILDKMVQMVSQETQENKGFQVKMVVMAMMEGLVSLVEMVNLDKKEILVCQVSQVNQEYLANQVCQDWMPSQQHPEHLEKKEPLVCLVTQAPLDNRDETE